MWCHLELLYIAWIQPCPAPSHHPFDLPQILQAAASRSSPLMSSATGRWEQVRPALPAPLCLPAPPAHLACPFT